MKQQGMNIKKVCELCHGEASLFCESDSAFLCWNCDVRVHEANFLVARHVRLVICSNCSDFDGNRISGAGTVKPLVRKPICLSCSSNTDDSDYDDDRDRFVSSSSDSDSDYSCLSSSSACISGTTVKSKSTAKGMSLSLHDFDRRSRSRNSGKIQTVMKIGSDVSGDGSSFPVKIFGGNSSKNRKPAVTAALRGLSGGVAAHPTAKNSSVDVKAEGILVNWCDKLGLIIQSGGGPRDSVHQVASHAFGVCLEKLSVLPLRVALAASLWFSIKHCCFGNNNKNITRGRKASMSTCQMLLKRVEEVTGVPAKLIALGESRIYRVLNQSRRSLSVGDLKEGWAECSD